MWSCIFIVLPCILIPSAYTQGIKTSKYGPLNPPECGVSNVTLRRIVGGQPATLGAWPWMTLIGYWSGDDSRPDFKCGGALISSRHVLTAAHCILPGLYLVHIGDLDLENPNDGTRPFRDRIERIMSHANFHPITFANDVAVLKTFYEVPFTSILHPICLPVDSTHRNRKLEGLYAIVAGWGRIYYEGPASNKLLQTQVPITTQETCKKAHKFSASVVDSSTVCAGFPRGGKDSCQGDSGGPLMLPSVNNQKVYYVVGIVSNGDECAKKDSPGIYARVTHHLYFITESMAK